MKTSERLRMALLSALDRNLITEHLVADVLHLQDWHGPHHCLTLGAMIGIVRESWSSPRMLHRWDERSCMFVVELPCGWSVRAESEFDALLLALEAKR